MSTTSMAIFLNPGFATYSVYARNASIVVKLLLFHLNIAHHCSFWSLNLSLRTCSMIVLFWFLCTYYFSYLWVFSRLGDKNFKSNYKVHSVRPSVVFVFEKCRNHKSKIGNWKHKQWFNSAGRSVTSLYRCQFISDKYYNKLRKVSLGHMKFRAPWLFTHNRNVALLLLMLLGWSTTLHAECSCSVQNGQDLNPARPGPAQ